MKVMLQFPNAPTDSNTLSFASKRMINNVTPLSRQMMTELNTLVDKIDHIIREDKWFDFYVLNYNGTKLTVAGSIDLCYSHTLEVIFEDVFFVSGLFKGWHSDTSSTVFTLPDNETELNRQYEIEEGYQLFIFKTEDYRNNFIIAARTLSFQTDTVFYYDRQDLKENERIADFVKKHQQ